MRTSDLGNEATRALMTQSYAQRMEYIGIYAWDPGYGHGLHIARAGQKGIEERHRHPPGMRSKAWLNRAGSGPVMNLFFHTLTIAVK